MIVFISAERFDLDAELNDHNTEALRYSLSQLGLKFQSVEGMYKGASETSFMVTVPNEAAMDQVIGLARLFSQESVLIVDSSMNATLRFIDSGFMEILGTWTKVSSVEGLDGYTRLDGGETFSVVRASA